jgi:hypothetical protein
MKKRLVGIIFLFFWGTFSWGQGEKEPLNILKIKEEQEIMRRILTTKLTDFAEYPTFFSNVDSFYLAEQGIVLMLNTGGFRNLPSRPALSSALNSSMESTNKLVDELAARTKELDRAKEQLLKKSSPPALPKSGPNSGMAPSLPAAPPDQSLIECISELQKTTDELREKIKAGIQESDKIQAQNFATILEELRSVLLEILANYGDSLTIVKPEEYVSFVLRTDTFMRTPRFDVISARKSWITDYKAGRLTLEAFEQKVIQCSQ